MATQAEITQAVLDEVYSNSLSQRPFTDISVTDPGAGGTTFDVPDGDNYSQGDVVEFADNNEQVYVSSVALDTLTVIRAFNGTTAAAHPIGTLLAKNPRFARKYIEDKCQSVYDELEGQGVWVYGTGTFLLDVNTHWYPIADATVIKVIALYYPHPNRERPLNFSRFEWIEGIEGTEFTETQGIELTGQGLLTDGDTVSFSFRKRISAATDLTARQEPLVIAGAVYKMLGPEMVKRTHDPGKRTDRTVQPGQDGRDSNWFLREYRRLVLAEQAQLKVDEQRVASSIKSRRAQRWGR